jgi:predicted nucleic acid-binding protein
MFEQLREHTIYLDTNIIIYAFEPGHSGARTFAEVFRMIDEAEVTAVTSELTLAEVLTVPYRLGAHDMVARYESLLSSESPIQVAPVDRDILRDAARVRANSALKLADAIHVATATHFECDFFFTQDAPLGRSLLPTPRWLSLADFERP